MLTLLAVLLGTALAAPDETPAATPDTPAPAPETPTADTPAPATEESAEPAPSETGKKGKKKLFRSAEGYVPPPIRTEWVLFPVIGQNPDVGTMLGLSTGIAHSHPDYSPFRWQLNASAIVSFRKFNGPVRLLMQKYSIGADFPDLAGGQLRLAPSITFQRVPNASYYGIGNASGQAAATDDTYYRYDRWMLVVGLPIRWDFSDDWAAAFGISYRYFDSETYEGSLLEHDKALNDADGEPLLPATEAANSLISSAGMIYDTRDWEIDPGKGWFGKMSIRYTFGLLTNVEAYGGWNIDLRGYQTIIPKYLVVAERFMSDIMWGNVPFYELDHAGAFPNDAQIGGSKATRGIPEGRYRGQSKILGQLELRSWLFGHMLGNTHVKAGLELFLDSGRVWAVTGKKLPDLDGTGLGIKVGTGFGFRLGWGEYGVVRIDFAWSKDGDPDAPFGLYMDVENTF